MADTIIILRQVTPDGQKTDCMFRVPLGRRSEVRLRFTEEGKLTRSYEVRPIEMKKIPATPSQ